MHKLLAWWQLLRVGNVFTAVSNVIAGFLIAQHGWQPMVPLLWLIASSAFLYEAGVVLNDAFDAKRDAVERPERPIPSGRISRKIAFLVGSALLVIGCITSIVAACSVDDLHPAAIAGLLALCIVGYDAGLKSTFVGPWTMGMCRLLNVSLGAFATGDAQTPDTFVWFYAVLVGLYTVGLTYFARSENKQGWDWNQTIGGAMVLATTYCACFWAGHIFVDQSLTAAGVLILFSFIWFDEEWIAEGKVTSSILRRRVQRMIFAFILMDTLMAYATVGWQSAVVLLSLLIPTWIASRFAPMT